MTDNPELIQPAFNMHTKILVIAPDKKVEEVIKVLQDLGCKIDINYPYLGNVWRAGDVKKNHPELGDDDCLEVLEEVFSSDSVNQDILDRIDEVVEEYKQDI